MIGVATISAEVAALVADGEIELQIATDDEPAADVIVMRRESMMTSRGCDNVRAVASCTLPADSHAPRQRRPSGVVVL